ncbi:hypothetical protein D3C75_992890 [compost metagenome]
MAFDMPRRGGIGQQLALRGEDIQLNAGVKGHQAVKQRLERAAFDLPLLIQQRLALDDVLRQPAGQPLHHRVTVLLAGPELHPAGDDGTQAQRSNK